MYLFDRVQEHKINGIYDVFAINDEDNQEYLLRNIIVNTSAIKLDGFKLTISKFPETYVYRGDFQTDTELKSFAENIISMLEAADKKNNLISIP